MTDRAGISIPRMVRWTPRLHDRFLEACDRLGGAFKATPKQILVVMNVQGVTLNHIKSHLQKHRTQMMDKDKQSTKVKTEAVGSDASEGPSTDTPVEQELEKATTDNNKSWSSAGNMIRGDSGDGDERCAGGTPANGVKPRGDKAYTNLPVLEPRTLADYGQHQEIADDIRMEAADIHTIEIPQSYFAASRGPYGQAYGVGPYAYPYGPSGPRGSETTGMGGMGGMRTIAEMASMMGIPATTRFPGTTGTAGMPGTAGTAGTAGMPSMTSMTGLLGTGGDGNGDGNASGGLEHTISELHKMYDEVNYLKGRLSVALNSLVKYNQQQLDAQRASKAIASALARPDAAENASGSIYRPEN